MVDIGIPMSEKVLSTKVTVEDVEIIKSIAEVNGITVSALLRELLKAEIKNRNISWDAYCFGSAPRNDVPKNKRASIDEIVYGK